jgi:hypothetical protein
MEWDHVFPEMTPPPGGLDALRARLKLETADGRAGHRDSLRPSWTLRIAAVAASIVLAVVTLWVVQTQPPRPILDLELLSSNPASVRLGLVPAPTEPVSVPEADRGRIAVERVEVHDPDVLFYRVAVLTEPLESKD